MKKRFSLPRKFYFFLSTLLLLIFFFQLLRLGMIWKNWDDAQNATFVDLLHSFFTGLRFDLATACYLAIPCVAFGYLPWLTKVKVKRYQKFFWGIFGTIISSSFFLLLAEFEFFHEFQTRYNQLAFQYLDEGDTIVGMIWYGYPVFKYIFCWLCLVLLFAFSLRFLYRKIILLAPISTSTLIEKVVSLSIIVAILVIGARGGLQRSPLRWGDAFSHKNEFINQMSLNGLYTLGKSLLDVYKQKDRKSLWKNKSSLQEARARVRSLILEPGEVLLDDGFNTVSRIQKQPKNRFPLKKNATPPNVVLILMESFSARVVGACGSPINCTPEFNKLCEDGILFDRALSTGTHTHQGIFSSTLGFPNLPGYEYLMKEMIANQPFASIPAVLKSQQYQTLLFYNSKLSYDNLFGFFRLQGIEHFTGKDDFTDPTVFKDKVWGVSDHTLFQKANQELEKAARNGPFFSLIITLSNHPPYDLPKPLPFEASTQYGSENKRFDGVRYADWAIGQFIEEAKKLDYFENTLFVFVGDHGFHVQPVLTETHLLYHHVPLLFYAPKLFQEKNIIRHEVVSQVNIAPSIFGLLELQTPHASWGSNIFSSHFNSKKAFALFKGSGNSKSVAFVQEDFLLVYGENKKWSLWDFNLDFPPNCQLSSEPDSKRVEEMQQNMKAIIQSATFDLLSLKAGLPSSKKE